MKLALITICLLIMVSAASAEILGPWVTVADGKVYTVWFLGCNLYDDLLPPEPCYAPSEVLIDDTRMNVGWYYDPFGHGLWIYADRTKRLVAVGKVDTTEKIMVLSWGGETYTLMR